MKLQLPSSYLPDTIRSAFRFTVVGTTGAFVQTGFFLLLMYLLNEPEKETLLYYIAFIGGFIMEMIPNYFISNWYTFGTRPSLSNAGGFLLARAINLLIQLVLLPMLIIWMASVDDGIVSLVVISIAGVINYLIQRKFFQK